MENSPYSRMEQAREEYVSRTLNQVPNLAREWRTPIAQLMRQSFEYGFRQAPEIYETTKA